MTLGLAMSDLLVAVASTAAAVRVRSNRGRAAAVAGFTVIVMASLVGVVRYGALPVLTPVHGLMSALGGQVGVPLIALGFVRTRFAGPWRKDGAVPVGAAALLSLGALARGLELADAWSGIASGASLCAIAAAALAMPVDRTARAAALGATAAYLLGTAAAVTGGHGTGIILFHLALAIANPALAHSLRHLPEDRDPGAVQPLPPPTRDPPRGPGQHPSIP